MKNQAVIIIPYFGKFPNYFKLWLKSVEKNPMIDVMLFTNNSKPIHCPKNVKWINMTFKDVQKRAQKLVDFSIKLNRPYKLCDYRPAYGLIFKDYLNEYAWWGWGDIDTIWGNLRIIINDKNLAKYDKLLDLGHLTLLKNNDYMNNLWRKIVKGAWTYNDCFKSDLPFHFDEGGGMSFIAQKSKCRVYSEPAGKMSFADIIPNNRYFELAYDQGDGKLAHIFTWKDGILKGYWIKNNEIHSREFSYIHLQKRKMIIDNSLHDINQGLLIIPNIFLPLTNEKINKSLFKKVVIPDDKRSTNKHLFINRVITHFRFSKFKREGRNRRIPLNGNEVYFKVEKPKY